MRLLFGMGERSGQRVPFEFDLMRIGIVCTVERAIAHVYGYVGTSVRVASVRGWTVRVASVRGWTLYFAFCVLNTTDLPVLRWFLFFPPRFAPSP